jgi:hypothetical protein
VEGDDVFVTVGPGRAELNERDDMTHFHVVAGQYLDSAALDQLLRDHGIGYMADDAAFISSSWLRDHGEPSEEWAVKLDAMIRYAEARGWSHGGYVQAHVERHDEAAPG